MGGWVQVDALVDRGAVEAAGAALLELGAGGLEERHPDGEAPPVRQPWDTGPPPPPPSRVVLRTWFPAAEGDAAVHAARVGAALARWLRAEPVAVAVGEEDWATAWKAGFRRIVISDRLAVAPPWEARPGDLVVEPGMAFGTGEHPTTLACLRAVDRLARPGGRCLDVGCGTGVLALAAARLGMAARGIDTDAEAVRAARANAARNGLDARFDATPLRDVGGTWDLVVANVFAEVLCELSADLVRLTGGALVLAGILADREARVRDCFSALRRVRRERDGDWVSLEFRP